MKVLLVSEGNPRVVESSSVTSAALLETARLIDANAAPSRCVRAYPPVVTSSKILAIVKEDAVVKAKAVFAGVAVDVEFCRLLGLEDNPTTLFNPYADWSDDMSGPITLQLVTFGDTLSPYVGSFVA